MRRTMIIGALAGAVVFGASPALAAPPEVNQQSCEEAGGTFSRERGVKSCTTTSRTEVPGPPVSATSAPEFQGTSLVTYEGTSRRVLTVETTTTQTQKGNGEVTTTSSSRTVGSRQEQLRCTRTSTPLIFGGSPTTTPVPFGECASRWLFIA